MDVASGLLHHPFDVVTTFANNMGMLRVGNIHLQSYPVALKEQKRGGQGEILNKILLNSSVMGALHKTHTQTTITEWPN